MIAVVKTPRVSALLLFVLVLFGCGDPSGIIITQVGEDSWSTMKPTDVQLRLGKLDGGELVIARGDKEIARGPAAKGTRIPVTMDDRACEVLATNTYESTSTGVRQSMRRQPGDPKPQTRDLVSTTLRGLTVEVVAAGRRRRSTPPVTIVRVQFAGQLPDDDTQTRLHRVTHGHRVLSLSVRHQ